jgi:hypothetical protein
MRRSGLANSVSETVALSIPAIYLFNAVVMSHLQPELPNVSAEQKAHGGQYSGKSDLRPSRLFGQSALSQV